MLCLLQHNLVVLKILNFLKNSNDLIYVGNFSKYVTELGFSRANPGGLLLDLDTKKNEL